LRGKIRRIRLAVLGRNGDPLQNGRVSTIHGPPGEEQHDRLDGGSAEILSSGSGIDVVVRAPGYRPTVCLDVHGDRTVVMRPGLPIRLVFQLGVPSPTETALEAHVAFREGPPQQEGHWIGPSSDETVHRITATVQPVDLRLEVPGQYQVSLKLGDVEVHRITLHVRDLPEVQVFTIPVPGGKILKALAHSRENR